MTEPVPGLEHIQHLFGENLPPEQQKRALEATLKKNHGAAPGLLMLLLNERHRLHQQLKEQEKTYKELMVKLQEPPWYPATFLRLLPFSHERALVAAGNRRFTVTLAPELDRQALVAGKTVFLNSSMNVLVEVAPADLPHTGQLGEFSRLHGAQQAVLRAQGEEEIVVDLAADILLTGLSPGDLLLYDRESMVAWQKVDSKHRQASLLEEIKSPLRIENLGGLDRVYNEILDEIKLHLYHRDVVLRHRLEPVRGILLHGPPGVGKTSLVGALANHLTELTGVRTKAFLVRPSIHRSKWFGESEERIRAMFAEVRSLACQENSYVILFFDDVDHIGSRDGLNDVDSRIVPSFLHEVEALHSADRILMVAATNRPDLLDAALLRAGRFRDAEFHIPRPSTRQAARAVLRCYLTPDLPYQSNGHGCEEAAAEMIEDVLSALFAPNGELATLATLYFRDGSTRPVTPAMLLNGALIKNAARKAKKRSALRMVAGGRPGITCADMLAAVDEELSDLTRRMRPGPALHSLLELPPDLDVVRVEPQDRIKKPRHYEYLTAAAR